MTDLNCEDGLKCIGVQILIVEVVEIKEIVLIYT